MRDYSHCIPPSSTFGRAPTPSVPSLTPKPSNPRMQWAIAALLLGGSRGPRYTCSHGQRRDQTSSVWWKPTGNPQEGLVVQLLHMLKEVTFKQVLTTACGRHSWPTAAERLILRCKKWTDSQWFPCLPNRSILYLALHTSFPPKWVEPK